jgi:hypothetical protein
VRLAKVLGCDLSWLLDDSLDFDGKNVPVSLSGVSDEAIIRELERRYLAAALEMRGVIEEANKVDWATAAALWAEAPEDVLPPETSHAMSAYLLITRASSRPFTLANPISFTDWGIAARLPKGVSVDEITPESLRGVDDAFDKLNPSFKVFVSVAGWKLSERSGNFSQAEKQDARRNAIEQINKLKSRRPSSARKHRS